jgi:hypothetical protein
LKDGKGEINGWKLPNSYHSTTFFMGKKKELLTSPYFTSFKPNVSVPISVVALAFCNGGITTGICFPDFLIDNKYPHMTLMLGKWAAKNSNDLLEVCMKNNEIRDVYEKLKNNEKVEK